jgi:hypothetical protein
MTAIDREEYLQFLKHHKSVLIENVDVRLSGKWKLSSFSPPKDYRPETTTVWSFPDRGDWATHVGNSQATLRGTGGVYGWSSLRHAIIAGSMLMENCWLAATALGLGACVSSVQLDHYDDVREISEMLGIPQPHWVPIMCLALGYPKYPRTRGPPRLARYQERSS